MIKAQKNFTGDNVTISQRALPFNQWTRVHDDTCAYVNEQRILRKPLKYYTNRIWAPAPTNETLFSYYTPVGNQRSYDVRTNLNFPINGSPTHLGDKWAIQTVEPLVTSPLLGSNNINTADIDINSNLIRFGELTNKKDNPRSTTSITDYNRWEFVDPHVVQNPKHIIFANGVIPRGGIDTRNELRNFVQVNCREQMV